MRSSLSQKALVVRKYFISFLLLQFYMTGNVQASVCSKIWNKLVEVVEYKKKLDVPYQKILNTYTSEEVLVPNQKAFKLYNENFVRDLSKNKIFEKIGILEDAKKGTIFEDIVQDLTNQVIVAVRKLPNGTVQRIKGKVVFVNSPDHKVFDVSILTENGLVKVEKKDLFNIYALKSENWIKKHAGITKRQRLYFTLSEYFTEGMDHKFKFYFKVRDPSETPALVTSKNPFAHYLGQAGYLSKAQFDNSFFYWLKHPIYTTFMLPQKIKRTSLNKAFSLSGKHELVNSSNEYFVPTFFNGLMETLWRKRIDGTIRYLDRFYNYLEKKGPVLSAVGKRLKFSDKTKSMLDRGPIAASAPLSLVSGIVSFAVAYKVFDHMYDKDLLETKLETIDEISNKYLKMVFMDPLFLRVRQKYLSGYEEYNENILKKLTKHERKMVAQEVYVRLTATDDYYYALKSERRKELTIDTIKELRENNPEYLSLTVEKDKRELEKFIVDLVLAHSLLSDMSASVLFPASKQLVETGPIAADESRAHGVEVSKEVQGKPASDEQIISLMDINNKQLQERWPLLEMGGKTTANLPIMLSNNPDLLKIFNELIDDEYVKFLIKKGKVDKEIDHMRLTYLLLEYSSWKEKFARWELFGARRYEKVSGIKKYLTIKDFIEERKRSLIVDAPRMRKLNTVDFFDTLDFDNTFLARIPKKDMLGYQAGRLIGPIGRQVMRFRSLINLATRNRMKAGVRGANSQKVIAKRDIKTKKIKTVAAKGTFFGEVMNKLGTVLVGIDLWSRCDGKQDILDLDVTTGVNPFIRERDNSFKNGIYNYFRSATYCMKIKSALGMDERKLNPKVKVKTVDRVTESLVKFMFMQAKDIESLDLAKKKFTNEKEIRDFDDFNNTMLAF